MGLSAFGRQNSWPTTLLGDNVKHTGPRTPGIDERFENAKQRVSLGEGT